MARAGVVTAVCYLLLVIPCSFARIDVRLSVVGNDGSSIKVFVGQSMTMSCSASTAVSHYHWMHMNQPISNTSAGLLLQGALLTIPSISYMNHLGDYQCGVTSSTGGHHNSNIVNLMPKFVAIYPANRRDQVFIRRNETALLTCVVIVPNDDASAEIAWYRISDNGHENQTRAFAAGNSVLRIQNARQEDAGLYRCRVATSESGQSFADIRLVVVSKPQLSPQDSTTTLQVGVQSHDLVCAAMDVSEAVLNFTWHVNGVLLESHPKLTVLAGSGDRSSRLHITNITYGEAANYTCTVSNMAGTVQQTTSIEVRGPPQITLQEQLLQITAAVSMDRLVLNCPYLANPSTAQVHWSKEAQDISIQDENEKYEIFPNGSLQISRITLSDSREYTCLVTNEIGTDEVTYTLLVIDRPRRPHDLMVEYSLLSAVLSWVSPPQETDKPVTHYLLTLQQDGMASTQMQFELAGNSTSFELQDLMPGENYSVTLQALNIAGASATVMQFTQPISAPALIFDVTSESDGYSLLARWQLQYDGGPNISKFNIMVYENDSQLLIYSENLNLSAESQRLTGLQPTTDYLLEMCISNGVMERHMELFITTALAPPGRPSTPKITATTTHVFKMTFTIQDGSHPITHLLLNTTKLRSNGGSSTTQEVIAIDDPLYVDSLVELAEPGGKRVVLVVGGLRQLTYYSFQVAAISAVGEGQYSDPSKPSVLEDGRILYYIIFGVVGGATFIIGITVVVAVVTLRTTRRIQQTKRTIAINSSGVAADSFLNHNSNHNSDRRSSNHSLQISGLNGLHDCTSSVGTPVSSVSDYKHHMLSSSTNGIAPLYDKLSEYRKESVASDYDRHTAESVSSDGHVDQSHHVHQAQGVPLHQAQGVPLHQAQGVPLHQAQGVPLHQAQGVPLHQAQGVPLHQAPLEMTAHEMRGIAKLQMPRDITVDMYASDGRINMTDNNGASAQDTTRIQMLSAGGNVQSTHSLFQQTVGMNGHSGRRHLPMVSLQQHMLCPPQLISTTGSSPAINYRCSRESILDKPTSYMTDV